MEVLKNQDDKKTSMVIATNVTALTKEQFEADKELFEKMEDESFFNDAVNLTKKYWENPSKGDSIRGIFVGFQPITSTDSGETIPAVVVRCKQGEMMSAATTIIDAFVGFDKGIPFPKIPINSLVKITCEGSKKVTGGKMLLFDVVAKAPLDV